MSTFQVDAAFFSGEPFIADASHFVRGRLEDAASVAVTLLAVFTFGCNFGEKKNHEITNMEEAEMEV